MAIPAVTVAHDTDGVTLAVFRTTRSSSTRW
ncbi:hypothetical protein DSM104299_01535 [Baekduia alba]|nr:hypothetical protein DSM104299_01535 [Baekduia alba]